MRIDVARHDGHAVQIEHLLVLVGCQTGTTFDDAAIGDAHIDGLDPRRSVRVERRREIIEYGTVAQQ